jgi:hypothetical protein
MVKGVTRRIVEIRETGSNYFERAIFFVRMDVCRGAGEYTLSQEARRIIEKYSNELALTKGEETKKPQKNIKSFLKLALSAALGALAAVVLMRIF